MKISIIGTGNIGCFLAEKLFKSGHIIDNIFNRTFENANKITNLTKSKYISDLNILTLNSDLYIIAISDDYLPEIIKKLPSVKGIIVHTSGSTSIDLLSSRFLNSGVIYPVQSISKYSSLDVVIPFCIEATNSKTLNSIKKLISNISTEILVCNSEKRATIHLAAVFSNNFTNTLYDISIDILKKNNIPEKIIFPLIQETATRIQFYNPSLVQTGPAKRNDQKIIQTHLKNLSAESKYKNIYQCFTKLINEKYHPNL